MPYNFSHLPEIADVSELRRYMEDELRKISEAFNEQDSVELRASRHAPDNPREGMIIHADGLAWNPGSGAGTYRYQSGAWVKIPSPADIPIITRPITLVGDTNYTILSSDRNVFTNAALTANRTWTLPAASSVQPHQEILVFDRKLATSLTNTLTVARAGSDTIDDVLTSVTFPGVGLGMRFISDGTSKWAAVWEFVSQGSMLENVGATRGSILYRGASGWTPLVPNTAGFLLTDGGAGADPSWVTPPTSAAFTTLADDTGFPAASTWSFTGLGGYKMWFIEIRGLQQSSGGNRGFQVALSGNNGSSYSGSPRAPFGASVFSTATATNVRFAVSRLDKANNQMIFQFSVIQPTGNGQVETGSLGPIDAFQLSWSGGATNFTGGNATVYGMK